LILLDSDVLGHDILLVLATHVLILLLIPRSDLEGVPVITDAVAVIILIDLLILLLLLLLGVLVLYLLLLGSLAYKVDLVLLNVVRLEIRLG
jgi:hypothetical protein